MPCAETSSAHLHDRLCLSPFLKVKNLYDIAESCLFNSDVEQKLSLTNEAWALFTSNQLAIQTNSPCLPISQTVFPKAPELLLPRDMPRRRLDTVIGKAAFFHALAHIEFMAIYLAWDIIYRFRGLPAPFYADWLKIADEEAQHFGLLRQHLQSLGYDYGDLPAHRGLWLHAEDTANDILARLAVVPRCMEARGLDVTLNMIAKFKEMQDSAAVSILSRIYHDEIGHVERGSYWFKYIAQQQNLEPEQHFFKMLQHYYQGKPKGPFNRDVRISAGFTHTEIDWLEKYQYE